VADKLRLEIGPPVNGWVQVRLTAPDVDIEFAASYTPRNSISDLARAAVGLLADVPEQIVTWNNEPVEFDFRFTTDHDQTRLEVHKFPDHRRHSHRAEVPVALFEGDTRTIARALWQALRGLQVALSLEAFEKTWHHPFPVSTMERLGEQLRGKVS
jgi:hypothetical protein